MQTYQTTYDFTARNRRMDYLLDHDFDAYCDAFDVYLRELSAACTEIVSNATRYGCVRIVADGCVHYLHRSARYLGSLQLTGYDDLGPVWDCRISDADGIMHKLISTDVFTATYTAA